MNSKRTYFTLVATLALLSANAQAEGDEATAPALRISPQLSGTLNPDASQAGAAGASSIAPNPASQANISSSTAPTKPAAESKSAEGEGFWSKFFTPKETPPAATQNISAGEAVTTAGNPKAAPPEAAQSTDNSPPVKESAAVKPEVVAEQAPAPVVDASPAIIVDSKPDTVVTKDTGSPTATISKQELRDDLPKLTTIDLTVPPDNLWQRVRHGFGMPDLETPLVAEKLAWYLNRPETLRGLIERSKKYLHHIVDELEKRGMPTELALLPMIESAFNPMAASPARALGMWQIIPSTGKNLNLEQNWWRDERRDIIASTSAALDYLQTIYEMHGDWHLALASYNWGENAVARAVAKNRALGLPTDYASLTMPAETANYVPKLQALKNIIAQPELFGFNLEALPNHPYFGTVNLPGDMDVSLAAKLAEVPLKEFISLNPAYHRPQMRGDNGSKLVLPTNKIKTFMSNLALYQAQDKPLTSWRTYTLNKKERLDKVAAEFGISTAHLKRLNGIGPRTKVGAGFTLLVPRSDGSISTQLAGELPESNSDADTKATVAKDLPSPPSYGRHAKAGKHGKPEKLKKYSQKFAGKKAVAEKKQQRGKGKSAVIAKSKNSKASGKANTAKPAKTAKSGKKRH